MIPKSEARVISDMAYEAELARCEGIIDEAIKRQGHGQVVVPADGWSHHVCNKLKTKYMAGDWNVEIIDSQRDGKSIVLS